METTNVHWYTVKVALKVLIPQKVSWTLCDIIDHVNVICWAPSVYRQNRLVWVLVSHYVNLYMNKQGNSDTRKVNIYSYEPIFGSLKWEGRGLQGREASAGNDQAEAYAFKSAGEMLVLGKLQAICTKMIFNLWQNVEIWTT